MSNEHRFQVNLRGMIDLLSNHLYSGPQVYIRELLQNAVDATVARQNKQPDHQGSIRFEVIPPANGSTGNVVVVDNGVGLTPDEVHQFLATIGQSSKRDVLERESFIGRFGIGLLSGFLVSEQIVVITRSIAEGSPTVKWTGRSDGLYELETLDQDFEPGTQVFLHGKPGCQEFFEADWVRDTAVHFGSLLPEPVEIVCGESTTRINHEPPWRVKYDSRGEEKTALLSYGERVFNEQFFDAIPLRTEAGDLEGVAYVLGHTASLAARRPHRVYLKNMLVAEQADNLLPEWAFFVRCIVNSRELRPTASRESFHEDDTLEEARQALGRTLRDYLVEAARYDPDRLHALIRLHYTPIKALATEDDELLELFAPFLPFETSLGTMTLRECLAHSKELRYVSTCDQFRQISSVAAAQSMCVLNAGYAFDAEILERVPQIMGEARIERIDPADLSHDFADLTLEEREEVFELLRLADLVLMPLQCTAEIKKFEPREITAMYLANEEANFMRSVEQSKDVSDDMWGGVLDSISQDAKANVYARLCLNYHNPLVRSMAAVKHRPLLERSLETLYVQSLLLGQVPLKQQELQLLNKGLLGLIELGVAGATDGGEST